MIRPDGFDAVVVGSGPNGLVAAVTMAEAGRRVLLVEAADRFGGGLRTEELTLPGFRHDVCATVLALAVASPAFRALRLDQPVAGHGPPPVEWAHAPIAAAHPLDKQPAVLVHRDLERTATELGQDSAAWRATVGAAARAGDPLVDTLLAPLSLPRAPLGAARFGAL
ncbi:NAD(P)-binding protein, partial [Nonomuraea sp. NPDC049784]|uniref:phytoene desaturase family protein n=1 Tax=Nonomuraea sp. NPDC049784 TaxID=3154361 RepID=UPI0033FB90B1